MFCVLAIMNNAAMNIVEQMFLWYECASFGYMPKSSIAGNWDRLIPSFLRNHHTDFYCGYKKYRVILKAGSWESVSVNSYLSLFPLL